MAFFVTGSKVFRLPKAARWLSCTIRTMSSAQEQLIEFETVGKVCLIGINRPEKRNCVNPATAEKLCEAIESFENDPDLNVAVLHGKGGNFCAGYDLGALANMGSSDAPLPSPSRLTNGKGPMGPSRRFLKKPCIAAVTGYCVAGGLELSLMCDMRIAESNAVFGVFCRRFGVPLLDGGTVRLPQLIGLSRALDMTLTGRPVEAQEALNMGLVNKVVPTGTALGESMKVARMIANYPQECMLRDRLSAYNSCFDTKSMEEAFEFELENGMPVVLKESVAGAQNFVKGVGRSGSFDSWTESKL